MTVIQLFGHDTSNVSEANFELAFGGLLEGVLGGVDNECRVVESAPVALTVEVQTGTFITGGVFARVSAQEVLVLAAADPADPRIDRVVCRRDNATNLVTVVVLTGVAAGAPVPPALTRAGGVWEISLAQVYVAAAAVTVNRSNIADERRDPTVCGLIIPNGSAPAIHPLVNNLGQIGLAEGNANPGVPTISAYGCLAAVIETGTISQAISADGLYVYATSGAVIGNDAGWQFENATRRDLDPAFLEKFDLRLTITSERVFVGLIEAGLAAAVGSDAPAFSHVGIQYSTDRGDTTWQFVSSDGAAQTIFDSQVTVTTDAFTVRILRDDTNDLWQIDLLDNSGNVVAGCTFDGAVDDVPGVGGLFAVGGVETRAVAGREFAHYYAHLVNRIT